MSAFERSNAPTTMAIVSTNHLVRLGLQVVINTQQHIRLIGAATGIPEAEELVAREKARALVIEMKSEIDIMDKHCPIRTLPTDSPLAA